ncbi:hypothetical protein AGMMS49983_01930 [Clostridia bacterium]|nr:hypothetical protein AGMMS49983_01930 [Clostridia bacterium]
MKERKRVYLLRDKIPMMLVIPKQCKDFLFETLDPRKYSSYQKAQEYRRLFVESMKDIPSEYKELLVTALDAIPIKVREGSLMVPDGEGRGFVPKTVLTASEDSEKIRTIYVLLTQSTKITSRILQVFQGSRFAHASIALERDGSFYSFNPGIGFTTERPIAQKRKRDAPCVLYEISVSEETYADIDSRINWFIDNPQEYKFNYAGMVFTILGIPVGMESRYYCSQFVFDLLKKSGAVPGIRHSAHYLPRHFRKMLHASAAPIKGTVAELSAPPEA